MLDLCDNGTQVTVTMRGLCNNVSQNIFLTLFPHRFPQILCSKSCSFARRKVKIGRIPAPLSIEHSSDHFIRCHISGVKNSYVRAHWSRLFAWSCFISGRNRCRHFQRSISRKSLCIDLFLQIPSTSSYISRFVIFGFWWIAISYRWSRCSSDSFQGAPIRDFVWLFIRRVSRWQVVLIVEIQISLWYSCIFFIRKPYTT